MNADEALINLAESLGVERKYTDNYGVTHRADLETALRILEAKGIAIPDDVAKPSLATLVACAGNPPETFTVCIEPESTAVAPIPDVDEITVALVHEEGQERLFSRAREQISVRVSQDTGLIHVSAPFPTDLQTGVHRTHIHVRRGEKLHSFPGTWIVCPSAAYLPEPLESGAKIAGVNVALYGIRSQRNWGVGDFSDLMAFVDWAADDLTVDFVGLNPLHALSNRAPYTISPYLPSSRLYRNFIYLDLTAIPDFSESAAARGLVKDPKTVRRIERLRNADHVDYEGVAALKLEVLRELFGSFMDRHSPPRAGSPRWAEFMAYVESQGEYLKKFAVFCELERRFISEDPPVHLWREWPAGLREPDSLEIKAFADERATEILFWKYLQWQIEEQLKRVQEYALSKGMRIGLYHDEALAVDVNGADSWALQDFFHHGCRVGAPPDAFAPQGQDWGFPPPNREAIRRAGYAPFIRKLRTSCSHGGAARIDHVMQVRRLFWIPEGRTPKDGFYVRDFEDDLLNILALLSQETRAVMVGEDLGTVPYDLRERLMAKRIFSYRLFYFERDGEGNLIPGRSYPENALVSISTHDLPTLAGFWSGADIDVRKEIGQLDDETEPRFRQDRALHKEKILQRLTQDELLNPHAAHLAFESSAPTEELHTAVLRFLFETPSKLVAINQEDIFLDKRQQNFPGTTSERANWVTRMLYTVEELRSHPDAVRATEKFRTLLRRSGRASR
ncbi:MAG: 4-alpha-glucanotransferase [Deltaproteobacteria bacterium]|nr:4-alpha-glucanotransferase [Deltaproteobacteria bacterium]